MPTLKKKSKSRASLSPEQIEIVGQFGDYAFDNPNLNFEAVARKELGSNPFLKSPNGRQFRKECKSVFDREREI